MYNTSDFRAFVRERKRFQREMQRIETRIDGKYWFEGNKQRDKSRLVDLYSKEVDRLIRSGFDLTPLHHWDWSPLEGMSVSYDSSEYPNKCWYALSDLGRLEGLFKKLEILGHAHHVARERKLVERLAVNSESIKRHFSEAETNEKKGDKEYWPFFKGQIIGDEMIGRFYRLADTYIYFNEQDRITNLNLEKLRKMAAEAYKHAGKLVSENLKGGKENGSMV